MDQLEVALQQENWSEFSFTAHKLLGLVSFFDLHRAIFILRYFEAATEKDEKLDVRRAMLKVAELRNIVMDALEVLSGVQKS